MSETETSENEASDIDECVSIAHKKFMDNSFAAEAENGENPVLSLSMSAAPRSQEETSPKNSCAANISGFVNTLWKAFYMDC